MGDAPIRLAMGRPTDGDTSFSFSKLTQYEGPLVFLRPGDRGYPGGEIRANVTNPLWA